ALRLLELRAQALEAVPVLAPRLGVEDLPCVAERGRDLEPGFGADEAASVALGATGHVDDVNLLALTAEPHAPIVEAPGALPPDAPPSIADRPEAAFALEPAVRRGRVRRRRRPHPAVRGDIRVPEHWVNSMGPRETLQRDLPALVETKVACRPGELARQRRG